MRPREGSIAAEKENHRARRPEALAYTVQLRKRRGKSLASKEQ